MQLYDWKHENHQQRLKSQIAGALHICICVLPREKEQGMARKESLPCSFVIF